ncbi:MAG: T9SS type A sorting domain-containing protein [Lewinella sp.]|nr:T9SS type A sorting domain-containing protein [Lewinella sp.]
MRSTLLTLYLLMLGSAVLTAQGLNVLLVDDSKDGYFNTTAISAALTAQGYDHDIYDAVDSVLSPSIDVLEPYDLVIWHTSTDGVGLYLWNTVDENNPDLAFYLAEGGNLWLIGNDFLYDRYDAPADTFETGDWVYDYLGIEQYDFQSFGDDGGLGLPFVSPASGQPIAGLGPINWQFPSIYWADAVTPRPEATAIYEMAGDGYVFAGRPTGVLYDNGTSVCLTFCFDLALAFDQETLGAVVSPVMSYFSSILADVPTLPRSVASLRTYPNPATQWAELTLDLTSSAQVTAEIFALTGQRVHQLLPPQRLAAGTHQLRWTPGANIPNGLYLCRLTLDGEVLTRSILLQRN